MQDRKQSEKKLSLPVENKSSANLFPAIHKKRVSEIKTSTETKRKNKKQQSEDKQQILEALEPKTKNIVKQRTKDKVKKTVSTILAEKASNITAQSYGIYDQALNPIYEFNPEQKREIASLTKMITLLVCLKLSEKFNVQIKNTHFRISVNAANSVGTLAQLDPKDWITVEDLLYGLMLPSGNDAAMVLAENFGAYLYYQKQGQSKALSEIKSLDITNDSSLNLKIYLQNFLNYMNKYAKEIHMNNTFFANVHGLDCKEAFSTVKDLLIVLTKIIENPIAYKAISTRSYFGKLRIAVGKKEHNFREVIWTNTHKLIWKKGYLGGKTGQTLGAGNCLATIYEKEGKKYYIVVLGCLGKEDRFTQTEHLVNKYILSEQPQQCQQQPKQ